MDPHSVQGLARRGYREFLDPGLWVGEDLLPDNEDASWLQAWGLASVVWRLVAYLVG